MLHSNHLINESNSGRPKGTVVEHRAISTSSAAMRRTLLMKPSARVFQFASFTFDVSVLETLTTLTNGGCICIPSEEQRVGDVAGAINSLQATWAFLTPSVANLIDPATVPSLVSEWAECLNLIRLSFWTSSLSWPRSENLLSKRNKKILWLFQKVLIFRADRRSWFAVERL